MIVLDLDQSRDRIRAEVSGNREEFYENLNKIKRISGAEYDSMEEAWFIPRSMKNIEQLESQCQVATRVDKYTLSGAKPPRVTTPVDIILQEGDINELINTYRVGETKLPLKDFQKLGALAARYMLEQCGGFMIGDEMGLGKTIQALAVAKSLYETEFDVRDKVLITAPKNVKFQWQQECEKFTDLNCHVVHGYNRESRLQSFEEPAQLYVINHTQLILDEDYKKLEEMGFKMIIVDEIHYFKNMEAKRTQAITELCKGIRYKLGLSGTPMQNEPGDIYSIYNFLVPGMLGSWSDFSRTYFIYEYTGSYVRQESRNLFQLKQNTSPYMIRRLVEDVVEDMPQVKMKNHYVYASAQQRELHDYVESYLQQVKDRENEARSQEDNEEELEQLEDLAMGLMTVQTEITNSLRLLSMSDSSWVQGLVRDEPILDRSNKLEYVLELIKKILCHDKEFKVVVFSKFARMVQILIKEIYKLDPVEKVARLYGDLDEKERGREIRKFRTNDRCRVIVMSDAGAEGINLPEASHLINYDLPWNPATLDQRGGRIRRIGSEWDTVYISNIITNDSIENRIENAVLRKRDEFNRIVENTDRTNRVLDQATEQVAGN